MNGNESGYALVTPAGTTGVEGGAAPAFALEGPTANPLTGGRLDIAFALPDGAPARLELLDVAGRRLATREVGALGAGRHVARLGEGHAVAPGLYFVRLSRGEAFRIARVSVLD